MVFGESILMEKELCNYKNWKYKQVYCNMPSNHFNVYV